MAQFTYSTPPPFQLASPTLNSPSVWCEYGKIVSQLHLHSSYSVHGRARRTCADDGQPLVWPEIVFSYLLVIGCRYDQAGPVAAQYNQMATAIKAAVTYFIDASSQSDVFACMSYCTQVRCIRVIQHLQHWFTASAVSVGRVPVDGQQLCPSDDQLCECIEQ
jgi:hypothetical protein